MAEWRWKQITAALSGRIGARRAGYWFGAETVRRVTRKGTLLTVWVEDEWAREYMEREFSALLSEVVWEVSQEDMRVIFAVK